MTISATIGSPANRGSMSRSVIGFMLAFAWFALCGFAAAQTSQDSAQDKTQETPHSAIACDPATTSGSGRNTACSNVEFQEPKPTQAGEIDSRPQEEPSGVKPPVVHYTPALNGGDPIVVPQPYRLKFLFGSDVTGGYDSAVAAPGGTVPASVFVYDGYIAGSLQGRQSYLLAQQSTSVTHYGDSGIGSQIFNRTAMSASGVFNKFWNWSLDARNSIGDNGLQMVNPLPARMVGQFATSEPVSAAYGVETGRILSTDLAGSLNWTPDDRQTVRLSMKDSYNRRFSDDSDGNITNGRIDYMKKQSERLSYGFYGQTTHEDGFGLCNSSGGGFQIATRPTDATVAELAVGPEFDSVGCGRRQAVNVHAAFAGTLNGSTRAYITANREFSSGYVRNSTWEDNVVIGMGRKLGRGTFFSTDAGYMRGALLASLITYQGWFVTTEVRRRLSEDFNFVAGYRRFNQSVVNQAARRNVVLFTLVWSPSRHDARRSDPFTSRESGAAGGTGATPAVSQSGVSQ